MTPRLPTNNRLQLRPYGDIQICLLLLLLFYFILFYWPRYSIPREWKNYAMQYKKVQNVSWIAGMNLTPPPSPNSHPVSWHCIAESERRVAEIKSWFLCRRHHHHYYYTATTHPAQGYKRQIVYWTDHRRSTNRHAIPGTERRTMVGCPAAAGRRRGRRSDEVVTSSAAVQRPSPASSHWHPPSSSAKFTRPPAAGQLG